MYAVAKTKCGGVSRQSLRRLRLAASQKTACLLPWCLVAQLSHRDGERLCWALVAFLVACPSNNLRRRSICAQRYRARACSSCPGRIKTPGCCGQVATHSLDQPVLGQAPCKHCQRHPYESLGPWWTGKHQAPSSGSHAVDRSRLLG